jgi:hypothetical protein
MEKSLMNKVKFNQKGFAALESLLILVIIGLIGGVGWYVVHTKHQTDKILSQADKISQSAPQKTTSTTESKLSTYTSKLGGFTLKYPSDWLISGGVPLQDKLTGNETQVRIQEKADTTKTENFGGDFMITDEAPGDTPYPFYPQGKVIKTFSNGISVWVDSQTEKGADGSKLDMSCPSFQAASNGAYGFKLKNGKWLAYSGSFCWGQGLSSALSYDNQLNSPEVAQMFSMLQSISQ